MTDWKAPGRSTVSPFIVIENPQAVIDFAMAVFGAEYASEPLMRSDGSLWNAEIRIGDCTIFFGTAEQPDHARPAFVYLYVEDCDAAFARALEHGASVMMPVEDQFYGDRAGGVFDMAGNIWWIATFKEDVEFDEIERRARALEQARAGGG